MNKLENDLYLKKTASLLSISVSVSLLIIKLIAVIYSSSLAILSSLIDSASDIFASFITFWAIKYSNRPLNPKHRYGYGKAESASALIQSAFIVGSGAFVLYDGVERFINPLPVKQTMFGLQLMLLSLVITILLICYQKYVIVKTKSIAIMADSLHYKVDLLTNTLIIISLFLLNHYNLIWIDIITAFFISIYLIWNAYHIAVNAMKDITDQEIDVEMKKNIIKTINKTKNIKGFHDFRSRTSGNRIFIEFHLEINGNLSLYDAHKISKSIEEKIISIYPNAQIIIHQDPYGIKENRIDHEISGKCKI